MNHKLGVFISFVNPLKFIRSKYCIFLSFTLSCIFIRTAKWKKQTNKSWCGKMNITIRHRCNIMWKTVIFFSIQKRFPLRRHVLGSIDIQSHIKVFTSVQIYVLNDDGSLCFVFRYVIYVISVAIIFFVSLFFC